MKRHLRFAVEQGTLIGGLIAKSGWHGSGSIGTVALRSYDASHDAWAEVSKTISAAIGVEWDCRTSALRRVIVMDRMETIAPHPALGWLNAQASGRWLMTYWWGEISASANIWLEDLSDATLFRTAGFGRAA